MFLMKNLEEEWKEHKKDSKEVVKLTEWFNILKDLDEYAKRRLEDLNNELKHAQDEKLKEVIQSQIKYWKGILKK